MLMKPYKILVLILLCSITLTSQAAINSKPIHVKVFIAAMFEIGENSGDKAGEFQYWYQRYFKNTTELVVLWSALLI